MTVQREGQDIGFREESSNIAPEGCVGVKAVADLQVSEGVVRRLTELARDVWSKAQATIARVVGEDRLREVVEAGDLTSDEIEVRPLVRPSRSRVIGYLDFKGTITALRDILGDRAVDAKGALMDTEVTSLALAELVYDPATETRPETWYLPEEAEELVAQRAWELAQLLANLLGKKVTVNADWAGLIPVLEGRPGCVVPLSVTAEPAKAGG